MRIEELKEELKMEVLELTEEECAEVLEVISQIQNTASNKLQA